MHTGEESLCLYQYYLWELDITNSTFGLLFKSIHVHDNVTYQCHLRATTTVTAVTLTSEIPLHLSQICNGLTVNIRTEGLHN